MKQLKTVVIVTTGIFLAVGCQSGYTSKLVDNPPPKLAEANDPMDVVVNLTPLSSNREPGTQFPLQKGQLFLLERGKCQIEGDADFKSYLVIGNHRFLMVDMQRSFALLSMARQSDQPAGTSEVNGQLFLNQTAQAFPGSVESAASQLNDQRDRDSLVEILGSLANANEMIFKGRIENNFVVIRLRANATTESHARLLMADMKNRNASPLALPATGPTDH